MNKKVDELRWVRAFSPDVVPKYLVEQIRHREFSVEDFYKFQELNCQIQSKNGPTFSPFNHLYVLANEENEVKGLLWFVIDPLTKALMVNNFSVDKEYWNGGGAMSKVTDHLKQILKQLKLEKAYWATNYPKHSERHGFKRSKSVLMEYTETENG